MGSAGLDWDESEVLHFVSKSGINKEATLKVMKIQYKVICLLLFPSSVCGCGFRVSSRESSPRFSTWPGRTMASQMTPLISWTLLLWYGPNGLDRISQWWYTAGTVLLSGNYFK